MSRMKGLRRPPAGADPTSPPELSPKFARRSIRVAAIILLLFLPLANIIILVLQLEAPTVAVTLQPDKMTTDGGYAYLAPVDVTLRFPYRLWSDDRPGGESRLVLVEDGHPLGPAHAVHQDIRNVGQGGYSHWADTVHFSASDNSDPRTNGRHYTATDREIVSPRLVNVVLAADAVVGAGLLGLGALAGRRMVARNRKLFLAAGSIASCVGAVALLATVSGTRHSAILIAVSAFMFFGASRLLVHSPWVAVTAALPAVASMRRAASFRLHALAVIAAAVFLYAGPAQIYPAPGWADPSIYRGYFAHYAFNVFLNGATYFSERLAFVLPGMLLFHVLPTSTVYYAMALLPTVVIVPSLLSIVNSFSSRTVTVTILILTAVNALVIAPVGQGYVSGIVLAMLLAGFAFLFRSLEPGSFGRASIGAGACFTAALLTNPVALFYLQGGLGAVLLVYPQCRNSWRARCGWGFVGGLGALLVFAIANKALTGSFDFLTPALKMSADAGDTPFAMPAKRWLPHAIRLAYVVILAICGILAMLCCSLARAVERRAAYLALCWAVASLLSTAAVLVTADVVLGHAFLMTWFYSCYFVIYTTVIAAAVLELSLPPHLSRRAKSAIVIGCVFGGALAIGGALATQGVDPARLHPLALVILGGGLTLACLRSALGAHVNGTRLRMLAAVLATLVPVVLLDLNPDTRHVFVYDDPSFRDSALLATEADRYIYANLHGRLPLFWYSPGAYTRATAHPQNWEFPHGGVYPLWFRGPRIYNLLDQIWCYYYTATLQNHEDPEDIARSTPDWVPVLTRSVPKAIVILSLDPQDGRNAAERASELFGAELVPEAHTLITRGKLAVHIWILAVRNPGRVAPHPAQPS